MPIKSDERCPFCQGYEDMRGYESKVYLAYLDQYHGHPHCTRCGAFLVDGEWFKECATCGERVDELYGLFVRHNCKECQRKVVEADRGAGRVCLRCRMVYSECAC